MKPFPCKDCKERYLGCSDKCEKYKTVKESNFEERKWVTMKNKEHMCPSAAKYKKAEGRYIFPEQGINRRNKIRIRGEERNARRLPDTGRGGGGTGYQPEHDHTMCEARSAGSPLGELRKDVPDLAERVRAMDGRPGRGG